MMAAEPSIDNSADVSAPSELQPVNDDDAQHGDVDVPTINGPPITPEEFSNKRIASVEDQINSADVSVSGGSDTEASRAEWAKQKDGDKGHGRTSSSTKKPATFKAVSVNKTFLAAKSSSSGSASKTGDKPAAGSSTPPTSSATLSVSRPRLVAKTGPGTGASSPRFSSILNGKAGTAPDPSAVWNKNRPTPAPEPKKLTDEELKKYGIHMASRLNEDDTQGGQNKWADIDDDDEDWAPEAITWGDGTKTTLPHSDEPPLAPAPDQGSAISRGIIPPDKPASPAPLGPTTLAMPKPSGLPSGKGLVLKSAAQEKPTLVAKPPAPPAPAKSPWATLPPVDRTPLVPVEPSQPSPSLAYARGPPIREQYPAKPMVPPMATREMAADDFGRTSWRDRGPPHGSQLFNSRSGQYEPVVNRHGPPMPMPMAMPMRSNSQTRYPAVLQRAPPQQSDQPEPSPAFQTSRTAQEVPFGRRRGSSNVSGGSGSFLQRMGKASDGSIPPPEFLDARRSSMAGSAEGPLSPAALSAYGQTRPDWATHPSPRAAFATPHRGPLPTHPSHAPHPPHQPHPPQTDDTAGLAPPPPPAPQLEDDLEYQKKLMREGVEIARKRRQDEEAREEAARRERIQKKLDAMGPPPERKSETKTKESAVKPVVQIQQRVHSDTAEKATDRRETVASAETTTTTTTTAATTTASPTHVVAPSSHAPAHAPHGPSHPSSHHISHPSPLSAAPATATTAISTAATNTATATPSAPRRLSHGQDLKPGNVWGGGAGARPERFSPWGSGTPRNVWGSPDSDRGLGNGTFNPDLGRIAGAPPTGPQNMGPPAPIGPPGAPPHGLRSSRYASAGGHPHPHPHPHPQPQPQPHPSTGTTGTDLASKWVAAVAENDKALSAARLAERTGRERLEDAQPVIKDTWRPVHVPGDGTRHGMATMEAHGHGHSHADEHGSTTVSGSHAGGPLGTPQSRPSRFFPTKDRTEAGQAAESTRPSSPSPPPPTMEGHPVYEGDVSHPHVSLPRPQPVVKLPPSQQSGQEATQTKVGNVWVARAAFRDGARQQAGQSSRDAGNWQDKINNLLNGGKNGAAAAAAAARNTVDAASKDGLDHSMTQDEAATVFLPMTIRRHSWEDAKAPATKPMAEECFEEQEMGSLPQIRLPHKAPETAWQLAATPPKLARKYAVEASAREPFHFPRDVVGNGNAVVIHMLGMAKPKTLTIPFSTGRGGGGGGGGSNSSGGGSNSGNGRGGHGRPSPRHRAGSGHGPRGSGSGSGTSSKRESPSYEADGSRSTGRGRGYRRGGQGQGGSGQGGQGGSGQGGQGGSGQGAGGQGASGQGGQGGQGGDGWSRYSPSQKQTSMPA